MKLYTLLYRDPAQIKHSNLKERGADAFDIYILCAIAAAKWAERQGLSLQIVTNDAGLIREGLARHGHPETPVIQMDFSLDVPRNVQFRSAHFKIEILEAFGSGEFGDVVGLLDSDVFFTKPLEAGIIDGCNFAAYDISANIEAEFGRKSLADCIELLAGGPISNPRLYGGEFIVARAADFKLLGTYLRRVWPNYLRHLQHIDHIGDEPVVSAALNLAAEEGHIVSDAGARGLITRWWSSRILYPQPAFSEISDHAILHLPADKGLIARAALEPPLAADFLRYYRPYARRKTLVRAGVNLLDKMRRRSGKFVPKM